VVWCIGIHMCGVMYWYTHVWYGVLVYTCVVWCIGVHMCGVVYWYTHVLLVQYKCNCMCVCVHADEVKVLTPYKLKRNADLFVNITMTLLHVETLSLLAFII
jgi:hypothetical protein